MISEVQVIKDMSDEEYFALDRVNASTLKQMGNPQRAKWLQDNPRKSEAMQLGTDLHAMVLQGVYPSQDESIVVSPYRDFRTKEAKEWRGEQLQAGKRVLSARDGDALAEYEEQLGEMAEALFELHGFCDYLEACDKEVVVLWSRKTVSGRTIECKAKLDTFYPDSPMTIDLKTCSDLEMFDRDVIKYGYYIQAAWYTEAMEAATGYELGSSHFGFCFAVAGTTAPYQAFMRKVPENLMIYGAAKVEEYADSYAICSEGNHWPSPYAVTPEDIQIPGWFRNKMEEE